METILPVVSRENSISASTTLAKNFVLAHTDLSDHPVCELQVAKGGPKPGRVFGVDTEVVRLPIGVAGVKMRAFVEGLRVPTNRKYEFRCED